MESTDSNKQHIVGSAEPLNKQERQQRLRELEAWGVDLSLAQASLERTPTERVTRMLEMLELIEELRKGYAAYTAQNRAKIEQGEIFGLLV